MRLVVQYIQIIIICFNVGVSLSTELACLPQVELYLTEDVEKERGAAEEKEEEGGQEHREEQEEEEVSRTRTVDAGKRNLSFRCSVFGIPSASVSWWLDNRLIANRSKLTHTWEEQFYALVEHRSNAHQVSKHCLEMSLISHADKCLLEALTHSFKSPI